MGRVQIDQLVDPLGREQDTVRTAVSRLASSSALARLCREPQLQRHEQRGRERGANAVLVQPEDIAGPCDHDGQRQENADADQPVER